MSAFNYYQIGGMNRKLNPFLVKPSDLRLVRNYVSNLFYTKEKRSGYKVFLDNPDSLQVYNLIYFKRNDGQKFTLRVSGTSIYTYSFTGATWGSATKTNWGAVADQIQIMNDTTDALALLNATTDRAAQGFKVGTTGTFPYIQLLIKKVGSPGAISLVLQTDTTGSPSGTPVTNGTLSIAAASVATSTSWVYSSFATAPSLTAGTQYHIVLSAASVDATNYYEVRNATNNVYANGVFKYSTNSGTNWSASSVGDMAFVLYRRAGVINDHTILNNKLIIGNGGDQTIYFDGSAFTAITAAPIAKYWVNIVGRAFCAGITTNPSAVYYSKVSDPTSWLNDAADVSTGGVFLVDPDNNGDIIGLERKAGRLLVHKESGIYKVIFDEYGNPSEVIDTEVNEPTISNSSIVNSGEYNYYLGRGSVFRDQGSTPEIVSLPLGDLAENVTYANGIACVAGVKGDFVYFSVGNITENDYFGGRTYSNCVFAYNKRTEEWSLYTQGHSPTAYSTFRDTNNVEQLYFGDVSGNTFVFDGTLTDGESLVGVAGTPIDGELVWTPNNFGDPSSVKTFNSIFIRSEPGVGAEVVIKHDDSDPITLGSLNKGFLDMAIPEDAQNSRELEVAIYDSSRKAASRIYGFTIEATVGTRRRDS
jgi:hypothetical protein